MNSNTKYSLILASKSPRRKELVGHVGIPFEIVSVETDEVSSFIHPSEIVTDVAKQKGEVVFEALSNREGFKKTFFPLVVASDTLVALGDKVFGKPSGKDSARDMLLELSGKKHTVYTAVYLLRVDTKSKHVVKKSFFEKTDVTFAKINSDVLEHYLDTGESLDKAGAYGIQASALTFITSIEGSYSNVVGFPLAEFVENLKSFLGYDDDDFGKWRDCFVR